jgi:anti-sigma-K factor RskA
MSAANDHPTREDLSAYALGALEADEIRRIQAHLSTCANCRAILSEYQAVADGMMFAVPPQPAPAGLRTRLATQIAVEAAAGAKKALPARPASRPRPALQWLPLALGLAVVVLLAINVALAAQVRALQQQQQALLRLIHNDQEVLALVSQPGMRAVEINGSQGAGNLIIGQDGKTAVLFLQKLPELDANHTYQVWLIPSSGNPLSAGLFQAQAGQEVVPVLIRSPQPLSDFALVGITVEPSGGSPLPTTQPILTGSF